WWISEMSAVLPRMSTYGATTGPAAVEADAEAEAGVEVGAEAAAEASADAEAVGEAEAQACSAGGTELEASAALSTNVGEPDEQPPARNARADRNARWRRQFIAALFAFPVKAPPE